MVRFNFFRFLCSAVCVLFVLMSEADQHWVGVGDRVVSWTNALPADRIRIGVRDAGVYRVTADELAAASGLSPEAVQSALLSNGLALRNEGREIAWTTDGAALYFLGQPTSILYAPENAYLLSWEPGLAMETADATPAADAATNRWFMSSFLSCRSMFLAPNIPFDRRSTNGTITNALNFGKMVGKRSAVYDVRAVNINVSLPGVCGDASTGAVVRTSVASFYDFTTPDDHVCEVRVNRTGCGQKTWSGEQALDLDYAVPSGTVTNGSVLLTVTNADATVNASYVLLDVAISYPHTYVAVSNALLCTGGAEPTVAVSGFETQALGVWDATDPAAPVVLDAPLWQGTNGAWNVAFACGGASSKYAVFAVPSGCYQPSVRGVRDTDWSLASEMPECAIVIPPRRWVSGFDAAVQPLVDFRNAQGLSTRVIDAEDLYNAFSDGIVHPEAFRRFCAAGVTNGPSQRLRYLLFAGHGGSDYKLDVFGFGERGPYPALFPLYLLGEIEAESSAALLLPNDTELGDVTGDAVPEVAVGRFIATNAVELSYMVQKTIRYEQTETWKKKVVLVGCNELYTYDYDFSNIVAQVAAGYAAGGWTAKAFYPLPQDLNGRYYMDLLWENTINQPTTGIKPELQEGAGFLYYYGHSNDDLAGVGYKPGSFWATNSMIRQATWPNPPVALLMGCRMGRWTLLNVRTYQQCLAEAGVSNPTSGFTAVISAAGYLQQDDAIIFSDGFRNSVTNGALRLGDAWLAGFGAVGGAVSAELRHMTLLGDPALCINMKQTARGTPTAWLLAQGLTGDPYADLSDPDLDGFPTWQEYQAGTPYAENALRIRAFAAAGALAGQLPLTFETKAGLSYCVVSATNLTAGVWAAVPWKSQAGDDWSWSPIPVDAPLKTVMVPFENGERSRFYKVETYGK